MCEAKLGHTYLCCDFNANGTGILDYTTDNECMKEVTLS